MRIRKSLYLCSFTWFVFATDTLGPLHDLLLMRCASRIITRTPHLSHRSQVKIPWHQWGQRVDGYYHIQSCTQKTTNFLVLNSQACFKDIFNMHAAFSAVSLFQNIISTSLLSKNSGNESFSGMNWMRDFSYSNSCENDSWKIYYLTENSEKCLCCGRE